MEERLQRDQEDWQYQEVNPSAKRKKGHWSPHSKEQEKVRPRS